MMHGTKLYIVWKEALRVISWDVDFDWNLESFRLTELP